MAIQNVRFESPASILGLPSLNLQGLATLSAEIVNGDLPAIAPFVEPSGVDPLWDFEIQASARNVRPVFLLLTLNALGTQTFSSVELSPGGSYSHKVADLSMMSVFKTEAEVLASGIFVTKIEIDKAATELFSSPDGVRSVQLIGTTVQY